jgi:large subunit ribosomal protein L15e
VLNFNQSTKALSDKFLPRASRLHLMAYSHMESWWRDATPDFRDWLRRAAISWRREPVVKRIPRPTKLVTARRLGYKAKPGIVMVRVRVRRGGARKPRPTSGRRQKAMGSSKFTRAISLQRVAERRVVRRYPNLTVRDSYHLYSDGMSHWYEVILMDHNHPGLQE